MGLLPCLPLLLLCYLRENVMMKQQKERGSGTIIPPALAVTMLFMEKRYDEAAKGEG